MQRRAMLAVAAAALVPRAVPGAEAAAVPMAADLRQLAAESARLDAPIVLFFSTPGCPYCAEVRRNYLAPRLAEASMGRLLLREVDITSRAPLLDFDGAATTSEHFATRHGVRVVPIVMAFDRRGRTVGDPLVGFDRSGFYEAYLQNLIDGARRGVGR
ncbi:MAG TPA: thioredoxin [Burkholderiaceae bacterium]|nr:thioredoxin [Burkholderiaceae bacterium]